MMAAMTADAFVSLLAAQIGKPYSLGAEVRMDDPNPPRFDCSELVQWSFHQAGATITDGAWLQYNATAAINPADVRIGDLVFLRNNPARPNGIGHVGIVAGRTSNGVWRIIEARGRAWGVTNTRSLSDWRALSTFAGVRRYPRLALEWPQQVTYPPTVRRGAVGLSVRKLQTALRGLGYRGDLLNRVLLTVDGDFGRQTERALRRYQTARGLTVDGIAGIETWRVLGIAA